MRTALVCLLASAALISAADPTFLRRNTKDVAPVEDELTSGRKGALYRPLFGAGDKGARHCKGIARYGELTLEPGASTALVAYPAEEQIYFVLEGTPTLKYDKQSTPLKANDFLYLPVAVSHGLENESSQPARVLIMGYRIPKGVDAPAPPQLMIANTADVPFQQLASHGPTTQFQLLIGTTRSKRDKLAAASQMVSLFVMDFAPGGTNIPHHHEMEEEIYYVLRGRGDMVAGGGADGNEGRYPSVAGDAWFLRLNTTVGFYSATKPGESHAQVLAVRSRFPFSREAQ